jgi:O-antigen/teichoic acid export membrane protein
MSVNMFLCRHDPFPAYATRRGSNGARRTATSRGPFKAQFQASLRPMLWLGALAATGTILFADDAIAILYGQRQFAPSAIVLKVYAPGFFLLFTNILFA